MDKFITAIGATVVVVGGFVLISFVMSWPVFMLWNGALVGAVDGVHTIEWTTAWGISLLCGLLFKNHTSK